MHNNPKSHGVFIRQLLALASFYLFLSIPTSLKAQEKGRFILSANWHPQTNWLVNENDYDAFKERDYVLDYSVVNYGACIGFITKNHVGLYSGIIYSEQGQTYLDRTVSNGLVTNEVESQTKLTYLKIPLLFRYCGDPGYTAGGSKKKKSRLIFELGPQWSMLQEARFFEDGSLIQLQEPIGKTVDAEEAFNRNNLDLVIGLGTNFRITRHLYFVLVARFDYSLNDVENKDFIYQGSHFYPVDRLGTRAGTFGLNLGFELRL